MVVGEEFVDPVVDLAARAQAGGVEEAGAPAAGAPVVVRRGAAAARAQPLAVFVAAHQNLGLATARADAGVGADSFVAGAADRAQRPGSDDPAGAVAERAFPLQRGESLVTTVGTGFLSTVPCARPQGPKALQR